MSKQATKNIILTNADHARLLKVLDEATAGSGEGVRGLNADLENARIVTPEEIPADVVTMNSRVILEDSDSGEEEEWILCFPKQADIFENKLSVLAPLGIALLGSRVGDELEWETPRGQARARVVKVTYQPESAGEANP